ncbi:adhesion G-protein coupled receptor G7, partial [Sebastes umbrosus]|uniref:adhesion G-protein coupled receptor G7 n=1 Tax=Sebastes umbrosus TaxID=72105 RepID=UPI00189DB957
TGPTDTTTLNTTTFAPATATNSPTEPTALSTTTFTPATDTTSPTEPTALSTPTVTPATDTNSPTEPTALSTTTFAPTTDTNSPTEPTALSTPTFAPTTDTNSPTEPTALSTTTFAPTTDTNSPTEPTALSTPTFTPATDTTGPTTTSTLNTTTFAPTTDTTSPTEPTALSTPTFTPATDTNSPTEPTALSTTTFAPTTDTTSPTEPTALSTPTFTPATDTNSPTEPTALSTTTFTPATDTNSPTEPTALSTPTFTPATDTNSPTEPTALSTPTFAPATDTNSPTEPTALSTPTFTPATDTNSPTEPTALSTPTFAPTTDTTSPTEPTALSTPTFTPATDTNSPTEPTALSTTTFTPATDTTSPTEPTALSTTTFAPATDTNSPTEPTALSTTTFAPATDTTGPTTTSTLNTTTLAPATDTTGPTTTLNTTTFAPATDTTGPTTTTPTATAATTTTTPPPTTTSTTTTTTTGTTPTSTTPPTITPLVCDNGGVSLNGVCICPDEWTGETCSEENFCQVEELEGFSFPITPIGWFAYSKETCPKGTSGAGKPRASTRCSTKNGQPSFQRPPQVLQCDQTLSDLQQNLTSPEDLEKLAASTQILTSKPEELTAENITAAAQIANTLLLSPNATESVRVAAVATVSQLLNASTPDGGEEDNATLGLTVTLDQLAVNLSLSVGASRSQVVQPNLVVQSAQIPAADTQGVQFTSLSGTSGSFVADRIQLNTNTSTVVVENGFIADAVVYVRFPPDEAFGVRQKPANVSLGFVLYQNDRFFRSRRYRPRRTTIRVLSATVQGQGRRVVPQHVEMLFRPTVMNGTSLFDFACVFWDYDLQDWSTAGCSKGNASDGLLRCFCNHTTNFAALWSFRANYEYAEALGAISVVGLSFSILGLIVTIIHHLKVNFQKKDEDEVKDSQIALLSICFSLLAFIITFVTGVGNSSRRDAPVEVDTGTNAILDSDEHVEPDGGSCSAVAALLHFFLLATFVWNSVYGTVMLWVKDHSLPAFWTPLSFAVGWGVPAAIMAITLGATYSVDDPLGYRQEEFCWLAALDQNKQFHFGKPMFWGFLLPVGLILIYNMVLLVPILKSIKRFSWRKFLNSFSLVVVLGLSWSLGYLVLVTTGHTHLVFSILFCLCTTTQGVQIFVLFTAREKSFREAVSRSVKKVSSVNIQLKDTKYRLQRNWSTTVSESYRDIRDLN